ncbi:hypothetical protein AGDE_11885 [Angomonas deanei]|uniref:Adenylate kinase n=1 Tax=Angomonas deanei TaxID=59799 RepID=A0A7G2CRJ5_9TRYP|nr:hypothetical protein AGDE_11885 [Angomonas deanei]CAD2220802.1 hypothetical protein, conserved [Angomonas deanei]|eukprot:EPY25322.1 hypothetical protein AGDE_11885 [Angomonas deanei]
MASPAQYKKEHAQNLLAVCQVQPLLQQLTMELALTRPTRLLPALMERLEHMEIPVAPPLRSVVTVIGAPLPSQEVRSARGTVLRLTPVELIDQAARGGRSEKGYADLFIPPELEESVRASLSAGTPVPVDVLARLFQNRIEQEEESHAVPAGDKLIVLLEGYPRTIAQALELEAVLGRVNVAILAHASPEEMEVILEERETVWEGYDAPTTALEEYWKARRMLDVVDGSSGQDQMLKQIEALLDSY